MQLQQVLAYSQSPSSDLGSRSGYDRHFVSSILAVYQRAGLSLSETESEKLSKLLDGDAAACAQYKTNLAEDKTKVVFSSADELLGCDAKWIAERTATAAKTTEDGRGGSGVEITLTLKYPDILPVLQNCSVEATRKKLALARETAYGNNLDLVAEGVRLRAEIADVLGYPSYAHYVTEARMSGSPEIVGKFLHDIRSKATEGAKNDLERLRALKQKHLFGVEDGVAKGGETVDLNAWDVSFYHSLLLKEEYGVDHEEIRKYFPVEKVVESTLQIYQQLLSLKFTELFDFDSWHPEVRLFVVEDRSGFANPNPNSVTSSTTSSTPSTTREGVDLSKIVGHFYLDLHPREGKYGHAAIFHLLKRDEAKKQAPVDCMLCILDSR